MPAWENRAIHAGWRLVERVIRRVLEIRPGIEVDDEADVWREFDYAAGLLADGRTHLCGERFTAADLTFAALAAAVVVPPNYGVRLPQPQAMKAPTAALVQRARAHPGGRLRAWRCSHSATASDRVSAQTQMEHAFGEREAYSLGVEEELFLVDPVTGRQTNASTAVQRGSAPSTAWSSASCTPVRWS